jgi:hypothetical protein
MQRVYAGKFVTRVCSIVAYSLKEKNYAVTKPAVTWQRKEQQQRNGVLCAVRAEML